MKKNLWVAVLLIAALALAATTGCVNALKEEVDNETYTEYVLDKGYNAWAGQVYQSGWAIGGLVFQGKGDALTTAKDLGYDVEMFQSATRLVIEMPDETYPRSGVDIIWGGEDAAGSSAGIGMWNQQPICGGSGDVDTTFAKKDGNKLIINLTKALKNYSSYKASSTAKVKIILQVNAPSYGNVEGLVKKATLMIPDTPAAFVSVQRLQLVSEEMFWTNDLVLVPRVRPDDATNQTVIWAIKSWEKGVGNTDGSAPAKIDLGALGADSYSTVQGKLIERVNWLQEEYVLDDTFYPYAKGKRNVLGVLSAPAGSGSIGKVTIVGIIKQGVQNNDGSFTDVKVENFEVLIKDPPPFTYNVAGVPKDTVQYGAIDRDGTSGAKMVLTDDGFGYTATYCPTEGYGNSIAYIEVTFPIGKKLDDYKQFTCHYVSENCDLTGKSVRMKAMTTKPPRSYNPGPYIATISFSSDIADGKDLDLTFDFYRDNASNADGTSNQGIYNKGKGADLSLAATDEGNAGRFIDDDTENIKDANKIYIWLLPWGAGGTEFTISNINFVAK
jgi:hypothetical protein